MAASLTIDMEIRRYNRAYLAGIIRLFHDTVHNVNIKDYTQEQVDVWAPVNVDMEKWDRTLSEHHAFVAVNDFKIIGFGDIDDSGYLDRLYVHRDYQRQGVATLLCDTLESVVKTGVIIRTHASITAKPFFEKRGYIVLKEQFVERKGVFLKNFEMELRNPEKASL